MSEQHDLLSAIDALTKPVKLAGDRQTTKFDKPLLTQLREAITNSLGSGGGAGQSAHTRTPFDVSAFTLFEDIDGRIRAWMLDAGERALSAAETGDVLRRWYVVWVQKVVPDAAMDAHITILERWATQIRDLTEPPWKQELTSPCPSCGQMWATVGQGEETESVRALWALWREDPENSYGICRACDKVWRGVPQMRQLRIAIDDAEAAREGVA